MAGAVATSKFSPQDVIIALLACSGSGDRKFRADPVRIQRAVANLKEDNRFKHLLKGLVFDRRDYFPYSEYLEESLDALQLGGYLDRTNPRGIFYQVKPYLRRMFDKEIKQRFDADDLRNLEEASSAFFAEIEK